MTPSLTTRITERISQYRAMLAAAHSGIWIVSPKRETESSIFIHRDDSLGRTICEVYSVNFGCVGDAEEQAANAALIAACVNDKEGELQAIEGLLKAIDCTHCEGTLSIPFDGELWPCGCATDYRSGLRAILTRWIDGRERDEKA